MKIELEKIGRYSFPMGTLDAVIHPDDRRAFAACMDGLYGLELPDRTDKDSKPKAIRLGAHQSYASGVALLEENKSIATMGYDGKLQVRSLSDRLDGELPLQWEQPVHTFWSWRMAISPDRSKLASVTGQYLVGAEDYTPQESAEPTVKILEAATGTVLHEMRMLPSVQCVAFDATGQYLTAGNLMGDLAVWDVKTGETLASWRTPSFTSWGIIKSHCYIGGIFAVAFSPDSESVYAAGMGDMKDPMAGNGKQLWQRFAWRKKPVEKVQESKADQTGEGLMETLAWHPSGEYFVMAGRLRGGNWNVGLFEAASGQLVGQAKTGMRISSARFSSDGDVLYLAGMQGQPTIKKDGKTPDFGFLERYQMKRSD